MSAIAGLIGKGGTIYMAADGASYRQNMIMRERQGKIIRYDRMLIGVAGYARLVNILKNPRASIAPLPEPTPDLCDYVVSKFVPWLQAVVEAAGAPRSDNDGSISVESVNCHLMIGAHGRLCLVGYDYGVIEPLTDYAAIGIGEEYALGSLFSTSSENGVMIQERTRAILALKAAAYFSPNVAGDIAIETLEKD